MCCVSLRQVTHCNTRNTLHYTTTHCNTSEALQHNVFQCALGWRRCMNALNCRSLFAKEPLIIGLFCGKWPMKMRHPMTLRHSVLVMCCDVLLVPQETNNTLQHITTHCNTSHTLQHTATHCNTLQHITTHCNTSHTLQHTATHSNTLQHTATHCNTLQHSATQVTLCNTISCNALLEMCCNVLLVS